MKIFLVMFLFNVHTGDLHDPSILDNFPTPEACIQASIGYGPQKPDSSGDVKIYDCLMPAELPRPKRKENVTEL